MLSLGERGNPRGKLCQRKRFDQIVVGTISKSRQLVIKGIARRQHQYGQAAVCTAAYLGADAQSITVRQGKIKKYDVNRIDQSVPQSGFSVCCVMQPVTKRLQIVDNVAGKIRIVLNQKNVKAIVQRRFP